MLGFDAEERLVQKLPDDFAEKIVWGSRYPQHDTCSANQAIEQMTRAHVAGSSLARMFGTNAADQFGITPVNSKN
jgi:predicted TIM-barrel fold metal-dependent hydrolase